MQDLFRICFGRSRHSSVADFKRQEGSRVSSRSVGVRNGGSPNRQPLLRCAAALREPPARLRAALTTIGLLPSFLSLCKVHQVIVTHPNRKSRPTLTPSLIPCFTLPRIGTCWSQTSTSSPLRGNRCTPGANRDATMLLMRLSHDP